MKRDKKLIFEEDVLQEETSSALTEGMHDHDEVPVNQLEERRRKSYYAYRLREWAKNYEENVNAGKGFEEFGKHRYCVSWLTGNKEIIKRLLSEFDSCAEKYPDVARDLTVSSGNCNKPGLGGKRCASNYKSISNVIEIDKEYCENPKLWKKFGGVEEGIRSVVAQAFALAIKNHREGLEATFTGLCGQRL